VTLEVYNFPLREQTEKQKTTLEIVKARRRIEMAELAVCDSRRFQLLFIYYEHCTFGTNKKTQKEAAL